METTELQELLRIGAETLPAPSPGGRARVTDRARRHRFRHRTASVVGVSVAAGIVAVIAAALTDQRAPVTVHTATSPASSSRGAPPVPAAVSQLLAEYSRAGGAMTNITTVEVKQTTWAQLEPWVASTLGAPPTGWHQLGPAGTDVPFQADTPLYAVVQIGKFNCGTIYGCHGRTYQWTAYVLTGPNATIIYNLGGPSTQPLQSFSEIQGTQTDLDTATGKITTQNN